ncbi:GGDEF domain-containing protein [Glaciecola petra]|uniref:diguanylate cyclase n=1 Tax=Glaciecola petra TaxID=3075602 RepID=A0ABU2ZUT5_9ALTE|nr:diguanylate cyclase [Aestuariibacter sp. P117]MDT0596400.1 diguanylate cyclase [Aestuariibacter sp. P117]
MLDIVFDGSFMPHGHCLLWRADLLFLTLVGDGLTVIAYSLIPIALIYIVKKRIDLKFNRVFLLFAGFIAFCGLSHAMGLVNIWHGYYFIAGLIKFTTGIISILTAIFLWKIMPQILAIPSQLELQKQNKELLLAKEQLKESNQSLEEKVKQRTATLEKLASTDPLTQVCNRRVLLEKLNDEHDRAIRYHRNLSILMLDIDDFKSINDSYGHDEGDKVIVAFAQTLQKNCRALDYVGRYGGEEFIVVMPETNIDEASQLANRIIESVSEISDNNIVSFSCSIGAASLKKDGSLSELIKHADELMYQAKAEGKNRVVS